MADRLALLLEYFREDPDDAFTRFAIAQEHLKRGDAEEAASWYEGLVTDAPEYVGTYYHLGKVYERLARREDAVAMYERGISVAREQRELHALSELQDALMQAKGIGWDDE